MNDSQRKLRDLIDSHLNGRPDPSAERVDLLRHNRIGDKLLELLIESIELGDSEMLRANGRAVEPADVPVAVVPRKAAKPTIEKQLEIEPPFPATHDLDAALELRKRWRRHTKGKKRAGGQKCNEMWVEAFKLTENEKTGAWSGTAAAKLLDASAATGTWLLTTKHHDRMKTNRQ